MANRYWVGGTASWDGTAGTKWSDTSGGAGGFSVPTTADDVFFDSVSSGTVTIATGNTGAKSINCTGFAGTITGTAAISLAGSITLSAGMTYTYTGTITITATGTITTAGKTFAVVSINATGGTVTLGDNFNAPTRDFVMQAGTFDTAGFNMVAGQINSSTSGVRTFLWRASTITLSTGNAISFTNSTNLTFTAGSSTFVLTSASASLTVPSGLTFYNVSFTDTTVGQNKNLAPDATYNNITIAAPTVDGALRVQLTGSTTVNGTLSVTGPTFARRVHLCSNTVGTVRTLTVATLSTDHCDFEDITLAGAASPASPTGAGNCGNNTNLTFPTPKTVYRVGANTTWVGSSSWATSSGGTGSDANFPLVQDTVIVDNATTGTSLTFANYNRGPLDMSSRTSATTLNVSAAANFYGSFILGSGVTPSGTSTQTYRGRSTSTLTTSGKTINFQLRANCFGNTLQLGSALTSTSSGGLVHDSGTFDAVSYNVTLVTFSSDNFNTRTLSMGSGLWTLTGTGSVWSVSGSSPTLNRGTANILLSDTTTAARTFTGGTGLSYNKLTIGGATGVSTLTLSGANTFTEIASTKTVAHTIRLGTNGGTYGVWSVKGTAGNVVTFNSATTGTRRTFNLTNVTSSDIDYMAVQDIEVLQANRFYVGANSTNSGNNVNVLFSASPDSTVSVTGVSATGAVGTVTVDAGAVNVDVAVTGVSAMGGVGSVTVVVVSNVVVPATGVAATGEVGSVTVAVSGGIDVPVTGVSGTGAVGSVTVVATSDVDAPVTGVLATGSVGSVTVSIPADATVTGVFATGVVGSVTVAITTDVTVSVDGVFATGEAGDVTVTGTATVVLTGVSGTGQVGSVTAVPSIEVSVSGVSALGAAGSVTVAISVDVVLVGVVAIGRVGAVVVWGGIIPDPGTDWDPLSPVPPTSWGAVNPSPGSTWTETNPDAINPWTAVEPAPATTWTTVAA